MGDEDDESAVRSGFRPPDVYLVKELETTSMFISRIILGVGFRDELHFALYLTYRDKRADILDHNCNRLYLELEL